MCRKLEFRNSILRNEVIRAYGVNEDYNRLLTYIALKFRVTIELL